MLVVSVVRYAVSAFFNLLNRKFINFGIFLVVQGIAFSLVNSARDLQYIKEIGQFYSNEIKQLNPNPADMKKQVDADLNRQ